MAVCVRGFMSLFPLYYEKEEEEHSCAWKGFRFGSVSNNRFLHCNTDYVSFWKKKNERKEKLSIHFLTHLSAFFLSPIDEGKYSVQRPPDDNYSIYVTVLYMITLIVSTMPEASGLSFMQSQYYVKCANKFIDTLPVRAKNTCLIVLPASL